MMMVLLFTVISPFASTETKAAEPDDIAIYALKFEGTPYKFGGTTTAGFDCSGYILHVFKNFDISLPRTSADQFDVGTPVSKSNLQEGDLVFFANTYKPGISHTGIYLGDGNVISAESKGVAISNINTNPYWGPKYAGAKRLSGVKSVTAPIQAALPPVTNGEFVDVALSHPAYTAIKSLNTSGIISGFEKQDFRPNESVTRGQAAAMVNRVLKLQPSSAVNFSDVSTSHRFAKDIAAMNESKIILGYTNGAYGVDDTLTKTQLAVILDRAFKMSESSKAQTSESSARYLDIPSTFWAHKHIVALKAIDQTTVFQTSKYYESKNANRSEFAAGLYSSMKVK